MRFKIQNGGGPVAVIALAWLLALSNPAQASCDDPPKAGVDWAGCDLAQSQHPGAVLHDAFL
ncbi:MAG: hypothetical protein AAF530_23835, partial [Pseudomonadota bacterium]